ncbi:unnamed protein product [Dovyalis caffra]|uniref:Uncharacterized protein n=1 Tax=Dovyalis caffra TaxID=77055 RepID=A0AAV1RXR1_9ROSI|nr:unnamed protein product [Dovyalis caffra]
MLELMPFPPRKGAVPRYEVGRLYEFLRSSRILKRIPLVCHDYAPSAFLMLAILKYVFQNPGYKPLSFGTSQSFRQLSGRKSSNEGNALSAIASRMQIQHNLWCRILRGLEAAKDLWPWRMIRDSSIDPELPTFNILKLPKETRCEFALTNILQLHQIIKRYRLQYGKGMTRNPIE